MTRKFGLPCRAAIADQAVGDVRMLILGLGIPSRSVVYVLQAREFYVRGVSIVGSVALHQVAPKLKWLADGL